MWQRCNYNGVIFLHVAGERKWKKRERP
jgi:hypothetical protein